MTVLEVTDSNLTSESKAAENYINPIYSSITECIFNWGTNPQPQRSCRIVDAVKEMSRPSIQESPNIS